MTKEELSICLDCLSAERLRLYELLQSGQDEVAQKIINEYVAKIERLIRKLTEQFNKEDLLRGEVE